MGENEWKGCLIRRGNGEKMNETQLFSLHLPKLGKKMRVKIKSKSSLEFWTKLPLHFEKKKKKKMN